MHRFILRTLESYLVIALTLFVLYQAGQLNQQNLYWSFCLACIGSALGSGMALIIRHIYRQRG